ncbi:MAG: hypothetical protein ABJC12_09765 [Saprospiraceae bacterium]
MFNPYYFDDPPSKKITDLINYLCPMIESKTQIQFYYEDETDKSKKDWRLVNPHLIDIHKTSKQYLLSGWFIPSLPQQIGGKFPLGWALFKLERIDIQKLTELKTAYKFTGRAYNPKDTRMKKIICCTAPVPNPAER